MKLFIISLLIAFVVSDRLTVDVYYESLCPGCQSFVKQSLAPALQTPNIDRIVHIRMIPYGNTIRQQDASGQWTFTCQHGEVECYGDLIELCAQDRVAKAFPNQELPLAGIIHCLEKYLRLPYTNLKFDNAVRRCAKQYKYEANDVISCANNKEGESLLLIAADETDALIPKHQWVPWAVANKAFTEESSHQILIDLLGWACDNYQGVTIDACLKRLSDIQNFSDINYKQ